MKISNVTLWLIASTIALLMSFYLASLYAPNEVLVDQESSTANKAPQAAEKHYVGASTCKACHAVEYRLWEESDHYKAMQIPTEDTVLGNFSNVEVNFHGISSRFYKNADDYFIDTSDSDGKTASFEIKHTFGFYPLQQYLVELEKGRVQALNIAWDSRSTEEGGQRWFHLQPNENITAEHPFYWTNHFQNWNSRCADCHSTNLQRNYKLDENSFNTTFSEINVACEACHGAGSQHVKLAQSSALGEDSGLRLNHNPL